MKKLLLLSALTIVFVNVLFSQNLPSYVPANGLVGYWPFEGNANDASGKGNHGTVNGATLTTDRNGVANNAYSFNGSNQKITVNDNDVLSFPSGIFSLSAWVNVNSPVVVCNILCKYGITSNFEYNIGMNSSSIGGQAWSLSGNGNSGASTSVTPYINNWHYFTYVSNSGNGTKLYVDGVQITTGTFNTSSPMGNGTGSLYFGMGGGWNQQYYFKGLIDDIAMYNRVLTQQEITALYTGGNQSTLSSTKVFVDAPASVKQNDTLELAIGTETLNVTDNVISFQTDFAYDSTRFTYVGKHVAGTLNTNGSVVVNSTKNGKLNISYMSQTALSGAGGLVKLKFKANNTVGQGIFSLANFMYNNTDITSLKSDTVNTIDGIPPSAKLTFSQNPVRKGDSLLITVNFNEKMAITPVPQINLTGQNTLANTNLTKVNDSTYTYWWVVEKGNGAVNVALATGKDLGGNLVVATPTQNPSFTVLPTLFGDIDTNKFVRAYDAALALQYSVGLNPLPTMDPLPWSNWRLAVANVDTVGNVTANDASLILQHSAKLISSFPADAKKRGDAPTAEVTVSKEGNKLVFRATGALYGFNVYFKENFNAFGQPEISDKNAIVATNTSATAYNVGIASTSPLAENEPFLIIPILTNTDVKGTMDIVANTQEKSLAYGAAASIENILNETMLVYPNPTKDIVTIKNAQGNTLRIVDFQGRVVSTQVVSSNVHEVSLKTIGTKGEYIFQLLGENNQTIATQKVVMQ